MTEAQDLVADIEELGEKLALAKESITKRFIGQERVVELTLTALLCGGHGLLIGLPGLGKTRLVETLSTVMISSRTPSSSANSLNRSYSGPVGPSGPK